MAVVLVRVDACLLPYVGVPGFRSFCAVRTIFNEMRARCSAQQKSQQELQSRLRPERKNSPFRRLLCAIYYEENLFVKPNFILLSLDKYRAPEDPDCGVAVLRI